MDCERISVEIDKFNEYTIVRLSQLPGSGSIFIYKPSMNKFNSRFSQRTYQHSTTSGPDDLCHYGLNFDFEQVCGDSTNINQKIFASFILEDLCKLVEGPIILLLTLRNNVFQEKKFASSVISDVSDMFVQQTCCKTLNFGFAEKC